MDPFTLKGIRPWSMSKEKYLSRLARRESDGFFTLTSSLNPDAIHLSALNSGEEVQPPERPVPPPRPLNLPYHTSSSANQVPEQTHNGVIHTGENNTNHNHIINEIENATTFRITHREISDEVL